MAKSEPYEEVCPVCGHIKDLDEACYGCGVDHLKSVELYDPFQIGNYRLIPTRLYDPNPDHVHPFKPYIGG